MTTTAAFAPAGSAVKALIAAGYKGQATKQFRGMEGSGYNGFLLLNGKKVAEVIDDASGGPLMIHWLDSKATRIPTTVRDYKGEPMTFNATPAESAFRNFLTAQPREFCEYSDDGTDPTVDVVIDDLINMAFTEKKLKAALSKKLVYMKGDAIYVSKPIPAGQMAAVIAKAKAQPGITRILNELPIEEAVTFAEGYF